MVKTFLKSAENYLRVARNSSDLEFNDLTEWKRGGEIWIKCRKVRASDTDPRSQFQFPSKLEHGPPSHFTESSARLPSPNFFRPSRFFPREGSLPPPPSEGNSTVRNKRGCPSRCNMSAILCYRGTTIKGWVDVPIHG